MEAASLKLIRTELEGLSAEELRTIVGRMARFKKDNKELLTYLLFEANDEAGYIEHIREWIDDSFAANTHVSPYYRKKSIMSAMSRLRKYIRYSGQKSTEVELLLHFTKHLVQLPGALRIRVVNNLAHRNMASAEKALGTLHPDLAYDQRLALEELREKLSAVGHDRG